jgi:hypothetical protein
VLSSPEETMKMTWLEINNNDDLRIFTVIGQEDISFALAKMSGEVLLFPIREIGIQ